MQEKLFPIAEKWELPKIPFLKQEWNCSDTANRNKIIHFSILTIVILTILVFGENWIAEISSLFLKLISLLGPEHLITKLFSFLAGSYPQVPALSYLSKVVKFIDIVLLIFAILLLLRMFSLLWMIFANHRFRLYHISLSIFIKDTLNYLSNPLVIIAGAVLGLTISVRILGPFFGLIVLVVALYRAKLRVVPAFVSYFLIAFTAMYLTWPYLWGNPISHFKTSLAYMIDFPWAGKVLFNGVYYPSNQLPIGYVPVLFGIQFTEPVIFLFIIGLYLFFRQIWKKNIEPDFVIIVLFWGILPLVAFTILRPSLYDNIRQLLFITPPLFLILGLALKKLFQSSRKSYINIFVLALILLPGIYPIIHLHPYEYTYYNSFVQDIYKRFELDYWATSFREAMEYLNKTTPENSKVIVYGPGDTDNVSDFARPDLTVDSMTNARYDISNDYQYVIISTRNDRDSKKLYRLDHVICSSAGWSYICFC